MFTKKYIFGTKCWQGEIMLKKVWDLFFKYKEVVLYLVFGGLTTLINVVAYAVCSYIFHLETVTGVAIAWIVSVAFAYVTNKIFVFESKTDTFKKFFKECISFFGCRLATGVMDIVIMYVTVDLWHFNDMLMKILSNVLVIVLNYVFSKVFIFSQK